MQQSILSKLVWSVLLVMISCTTAAKAAKPQKGETAPDFEGKTVDGKIVRLSDFKGKVVLLDFWATWCGPCRAETPNVIKAYEQFHELGFEVIGINMDKDKERMQAYMKEKNLQGQHTFSGKGWEDPIARQYGVSGIPTMMVLDKDQKVYSPNARGHRLQQALAELFGITNSIEKKAVELENLKAAGDTVAFEQAAEGFSELLIEEPHFLNEMAWDWANNQQTNYQAAVIAARKAVQLRPKALHMLDTLAYAESGAGYYDESVEHFTQCVDQGMTESSSRLATVLALRNQPGDLEKAYEIVKKSVLAGSVDRYLQEAIDALRQSPFDKEAIQKLNDQVERQQAMTDLLNSDNLLDPEQAKAFRQDASRFNGHDYKVFRVPLGWEKARIRCREMGGYLACITSPEENEFIVNLAKETPYPPSTCCWIGGKENDWGAFARWVSGEPLKMSDHVVNENPRELYLNLRLHSGNWEDYPDTGEGSGGQWFVCEWPSDDPSQDHPEFAHGTLAQCPDKRELKAHIDRARKRVKDSGKGHVIVGQVVLDGEGDVREVNAQMEILADGYFAGPVKDLNRPVGFRMHQYAPYDLKLEGNEAASVIDVGILHLKPLKKDELQGVKGQIVLEDGGDLAQTKVMLSVMHGPVNTPSNGTSPRSFWPQPTMISAQEDGTIEMDGFSPIKYYCIISAPDYLEYTHPVEFTAGQTLDLGTITLEKPKQIKLSYIVSEEPPFDLNSIKNATLPAGTRWKATDDIYGWDLEFKQEKGAILLNYSYAPCQLWDLGKGDLEDFIDPDSKSNGIRPRKYSVNSGHIYLVNQGHWKRWILLKIDTDDEPSGLSEQTAKKM